MNLLTREAFYTIKNPKPESYWKKESPKQVLSLLLLQRVQYATHGINTIPFYFFYSMFGFQHTGDFIWAAADARARGFLIGGTSGRTTLPGEGLQHQDGHNHAFAYARRR